jgi:hypothetical protein
MWLYFQYDIFNNASSCLYFKIKQKWTGVILFTVQISSKRVLCYSAYHTDLDVHLQIYRLHSLYRCVVAKINRSTDITNHRLIKYCALYSSIHSLCRYSMSQTGYKLETLIGSIGSILGLFHVSFSCMMSCFGENRKLDFSFV